MASRSSKTEQLQLNIPPKVITGTITSNTPGDSWPHPNSVTDPWWQGAGNRPYQWQLVITVTPVNHGSNLTRDDFAYNGYDIVVGDWVGFVDSGECVKIVSIEAKTDTEITCTVEDFLRYNTFRNSGGVGIPTSSNVVFFSLNEEGLPMLDSGSFPSASGDLFVRNITSRFNFLNLQSNYVLNQTAHGFARGDVISVISTGFVKSNADTAAKMVGVVNEAGPGPNQFIIEPNQRIIDYNTDIPGVQGDYVYVAQDGTLTANAQLATDKLAYLIMENAVPSVQTGTVTNPSTASADSIVLNGETISFGSGANATTLAGLINAETANTGVVASEVFAPTSVTSSLTGLAYGLVGGFVPFSANINGVTVNFTTDTAGQAAFGQAVSIPADMKTDIDAAGIPGLRVDLPSGPSSTTITLVEENGNAITITNVTNDVNGTPFASDSVNDISGLAENTPASTDTLLRLTRADGGPIDIFDSSLTFTTATGVFGGQSGRPVTALNIEQGIRQGGLYVVPDIAARDNIAAIIGDQAYVLNKGDGEWGLYVYDGSVWVQTADQDSAQVDARTLVNTYDVSVNGANTVIELGNVSIGRKITQIGIEVDQAFDGTPFSEVSVTSADNTIVVADGNDSDLNTAGRYVTNPNYVHTDVAGQELSMVANVALNGATVGNVTIRLTYV